MITVQTEDFNIQEEHQALLERADNIGAVVTFTGLVREFYQSSGEKDAKRVETLTLEHYPGMTEKALQEILTEAESRWEILASRIIHRVGELKVGEQIVYVAVASSHRQDAFAAAEFLMDYLKTRAPFWKKQRTSEQESWIEARNSDDEAASRWQQ